MLSDHSARDDAWYAAWRERELARVDAAGLAYLDYTGAALAPASLLRGDAERLLGGVLGNPHSEHLPSRAASADLAAARTAILDFLHADPAEYVVILTANASAASRLVGESWPWDAHSPLLLGDDNHNSVQGLREYAIRGGAPLVRLGLDPELRFADAPAAIDRAARQGRGLLAYPAQSNFSGVRHPLALVDQARSAGHEVLLDAAALLHSSRLDLGTVRPGFVILSLYKISGHPTGIGALVARRDALARLRRPWFAGGTVEWVAVDEPRHRLRAEPEAFEDGTPNFLASGAVAPALALVTRDGGSRLARHLASLTGSLLDGLATLRHGTGAPMVEVYGPHTTVDRGATISCNLLDRDGGVIPFWEVESAAAAAGLAVRSGCFCNPGCGMAAFGWPARAGAAAMVDLGDRFSIPALAERLAPHPVGAIRLSFGLGSVGADVSRALEVLERIATGNETPRLQGRRGARAIAVGR